MGSLLLPASLLVLVVVWRTVNGHGYLQEPPSRSSMWRFGFNTPPNYNDNALNCGGLGMQWYVNSGKCGVCGDPWNDPQPRANEAGGRYGKGIITRNYRMGQTIDIGIMVTSNHQGWFEFRLCAHNSPTTPITLECLDQHLLQLADGSGTRYILSPTAVNVEIKVKLPPGLTCSQCVLQWKWHVGNNRGGNETIQEEFYGCSDVAIASSESSSSSQTPPPTTGPKVPEVSSSTAYAHHPLACHAIGTWQGFAMDEWCAENCPQGLCPEQTCKCDTDLSSPPNQPVMVTTSATSGPMRSSAGPCHAINSWQGVETLERYCAVQCPLGNCPDAYCSCTGTSSASIRQTTAAIRPHCLAIGAWKGDSLKDQWCNDNCPTLCPSQNCQCDTSSPTSPITPVVTKASAMPTTAPAATLSTTAPVVTTSTTAPAVVSQMACRAVGQWAGQADLDRWCKEMCPTFACDPQYCRCDSSPTSTASLPGSSKASNVQCYAINSWAGNVQLDDYCKRQCPQANCPAAYCACGVQPITQMQKTPLPIINQPFTATPATTTNPLEAANCRAVKTWDGVPELDLWCRNQCAVGNCPADYCQCHP